MTRGNEPSVSLDRSTLQGDCAGCFGLCCTALPYAKSADFPADKAAGVPCANLQPDYRCRIHEALREQGYRGCTVYDCFGAGQAVSQVLYGGIGWREAPQTAGQMFAVFPVVRQLYEMLWYLTEALSRPAAAALHEELAAVRSETERLAHQSPEEVLAIDVAAHRAIVGSLLGRVSALVRAEYRTRPAAGSKRRTDIARGADLIGAKLRGADLRGADLRGAYLIAADLRDADLRGADLLGTDLRDADIRGARLDDCLFLTPQQLSAAKGDARTRLPDAFHQPAHWAAG